MFMFCLSNDVSNEHKLSIWNQETNKSAIAKHCWENDHTFNFHCTQIICKSNSVLKLNFLKHSISIKIIIMLSTVNFAIPSSSDYWKSYIKCNFFWFFKLFPALKVSLKFWFSIGQSFGLSSLLLDPLKNYSIRAWFAISLCTEEGVLISTGTAECNLSEFYWCSKCCLCSCYL